MRLCFGIIIGFFLAVGLAYFHDSSVKAASKQIVNCEILGTVAQDQTVALRRLWSDTIGKIGKNQTG